MTLISGHIEDPINYRQENGHRKSGSGTNQSPFRKSIDSKKSRLSSSRLMTDLNEESNYLITPDYSYARSRTYRRWSPAEQVDNSPYLKRKQMHSSFAQAGYSYRNENVDQSLEIFRRKSKVRRFFGYSPSGFNESFQADSSHCSSVFTLNRLCKRTFEFRNRFVATCKFVFVNTKIVLFWMMSLIKWLKEKTVVGLATFLYQDFVAGQHYQADSTRSTELGLDKRPLFTSTPNRYYFRDRPKTSDPAINADILSSSSSSSSSSSEWRQIRKLVVEETMFDKEGKRGVANEKNDVIANGRIGDARRYATVGKFRGQYDDVIVAESSCVSVVAKTWATAAKLFRRCFSISKSFFSMVESLFSFAYGIFGKFYDQPPTWPTRNVEKTYRPMYNKTKTGWRRIFCLLVFLLPLLLFLLYALFAKWSHFFAYDSRLSGLPTMGKMTTDELTLLEQSLEKRMLAAMKSLQKGDYSKLDSKLENVNKRLVTLEYMTYLTPKDLIGVEDRIRRLEDRVSLQLREWQMISETHKVEYANSLRSLTNSFEGKLALLNGSHYISKFKFDELNKSINLLSRKECNCSAATGYYGLSATDVRSLIREAITTYDADKTGLPDYAFEPAGGSIIDIRCTETFESKTRQFSWSSFPLWYLDFPPRTVIQPYVAPGKCWAFKGSMGSIVIKLSRLIRVTGVSYEHIPKSISPENNIDSAPKRMQLLGLMTAKDDTAIHLSNFTFDNQGSALQYFPVQSYDAVAVPIVEWKVLSNYGHPVYTCLYRIRVHGVPANGQEVEP